jgi:hypothetical protein
MLELLCLCTKLKLRFKTNLDSKSNLSYEKYGSKRVKRMANSIIILIILWKTVEVLFILELWVIFENLKFQKQNLNLDESLNLEKKNKRKDKRKKHKTLPVGPIPAFLDLVSHPRGPGPHVRHGMWVWVVEREIGLTFS